VIVTLNAVIFKASVSVAVGRCPRRDQRKNFRFLTAPRKGFRKPEGGKYLGTASDIEVFNLQAVAAVATFVEHSSLSLGQRAEGGIGLIIRCKVRNFLRNHHHPRLQKRLKTAENYVKLS